jgi:hypothetical protein
VHKVIALNHHYAKEGKVYLGAGGRRVLHVFPDLPESAATIALRLELTKRAGRDAEYDDVICPYDRREPPLTKNITKGWGRPARR